jgi:hypothetical protein
MSGRAIEALVALLNVLVISLVGLTPLIPRAAFAAFLLVVTVDSAISPVRAHRAGAGRPLRTSELARVVTAAALTVTLFLAGVTLAADSGGGLYWLPAAFVIAVFVAAVNAWVLLVEVVR